jgi:hypothetical protein
MKQSARSSPSARGAVGEALLEIVEDRLGDIDRNGLNRRRIPP